MALTNETRAQNSWLNFDPTLLREVIGDAKAAKFHPDNWKTINVGEHNQNANVEDTIFADHKNGVLPEWTWTEGRAGDQGFTASEKSRPALTLLKPEDVIRPDTIAAVRAAVTKYKRPDGPDPLTKEQRLMGEVALKPSFDAARATSQSSIAHLSALPKRLAGLPRRLASKSPCVR
jgi:hypothetical protein